MSETQEVSTTDRYSRKGFLGRLGVGAVAVGTASVAAPGTASARCGSAGSVQTNRFTRIFRLPAFAEPTPRVQAALLELGKAGGPLDARDPLEKGPVLLITDLSLSANNPNNPSHTAGTTFLGQFVDHDVTFDAGSRLGVPTAPEKARNSRTPALDLDSVYGAGPVVDQLLYDPRDRVKLKVESGGLFEDLPRLGDGAALVADPRNDEHLILSGLHCAFLRFHNNAVDVVRQAGASALPEVFAKARELTVWHYQWIVLHEFLPLFIGGGAVRDILRRGARFYRPELGAAAMPVEFQGAVYRVGHSMVRPSYRANLAGDGGKPFFAPVFDLAEAGKPDPNDLSGGLRTKRRFIDWQTFFDFGDGEVKPNKLIDTKLSTPLFQLPLGAIASHDDRDLPRSLPQRTLLRHLTWQLPSGQRVARQMGLKPLGGSDFADLRTLGAGLESRTPLWYYVLREAELAAGGQHLGPVGGRIVGEVLIGLMRSDPASYLARRPSWRPTLPSRQPGDFRMVDFLTFAGVDPASRRG